MLNEVINLRKDNPEVTLTTYVASDGANAKPRRAILVLPGGGYEMLAHHEGEKIALNYLAAGINAFVLNYSTKGNNKSMKYPMPQVDVANAMKYIKDNAGKYNIDPEKVFVIGFSAGGHLAATAGVFWDREEIYKDAEPMDYGYNKPCGMILSYPVINYNSNKGSFHNLAGEGLEENEYNYYSPDLYVDDKTCPAFIWHTSDDPAVNVQGSLSLASKLKDNNIPFEMHIYPHGNHGLGLPDGNASVKLDNVATWMKHSIEWIKSI